MITRPLVEEFLKGKLRAYRKEHYIPGFCKVLYIQKYGKEPYRPFENPDDPFGWQHEFREDAEEIRKRLETELECTGCQKREFAGNNTYQCPKGKPIVESKRSEDYGNCLREKYPQS